MCYKRDRTAVIKWKKLEVEVRRLLLSSAIQGIAIINIARCKRENDWEISKVYGNREDVGRVLTLIASRVM